MKIIVSNRKLKADSEAKKFFFENYDPNVRINVTATAESLNVTRQTIYNWIKEFEQQNK